MTLVVIVALGAGAGLVGIVSGLRSHMPSLEAVLSSLREGERSPSAGRQGWSDAGQRRIDLQMVGYVATSVRESRLFSRQLSTRLALTDTSLEDLTARCIVGAAAGLLVPVVTWVLMAAGGMGAPLGVPLAAGLVFGIVGVLLPVAELHADAKRARRHAKAVLCSFLDLVVLGLAGGMGIESALLTAAQLGENSVSRRMVRALSLARDAGEPPWTALARMGEALGIEELGELAAAAGLAGMEGARVRSTLVARAASLRRHELAYAEAEANALTERLFMPGAFLLIGFLIFVGYPAFVRISSGL
jgi:tight adherence protein C